MAFALFCLLFKPMINYVLYYATFCMYHQAVGNDDEMAGKMGHATPVVVVVSSVVNDFLFHPFRHTYWLPFGI